jgi:hypothetical protein
MKELLFYTTNLIRITLALMLLMMPACESDEEPKKPVYYSTLRFKLEDANVVIGKTIELQPKRVLNDIPTVTSWSWRLISQPDNGQPILINADSAKLKFLADLPGSYQLELTGSLPGQMEVETLTVYAYNVAELSGSYQAAFVMDAGILKLYEFQNKLHVGGEFKQIDGVKAQGFSSFDGSGWSGPKLEVDSDYGPWVSDITEYQADLYIAGYFNQVDNLPVNGLAKWDGNQWYPVPGIVNGRGEVMREHQGELYILGDFELPGQQYYQIIKWDGNQVTGVPSPSSLPRDLEVFNHQLHASSIAGSEPLWVFNGEEWNGIALTTQDIPWIDNNLSNGYGDNITAFKEQLFIHLGFTTFYGDEDSRNSATSELVIWDGVQFKDFGRPFSLKPWSAITDLTVFNEVLYIVGSFEEGVLGTSSNGMVTWDGQQWGVVKDGAGAAINAIQEFQGNLYLAGKFGFTHQVAVWQP